MNNSKFGVLLGFLKKPFHIKDARAAVLHWMGRDDECCGSRGTPYAGARRAAASRDEPQSFGSGWVKDGRGKRACQFLTRVRVALGVMERCQDGMLGALVRTRLRAALGPSTRQASSPRVASRTRCMARANPNSGQFGVALNLGKDFEIGNFTLGPVVGAQ